MAKIFTFKREAKETGLARIGNPYQSVIIKHLKKEVGRIAAPNWTSKDNKWLIRLMTKTEGGCGWKWIQLKARFNDEEAAREFIIANAEQILAFGLHHMD